MNPSVPRLQTCPSEGTLVKPSSAGNPIHAGRRKQLFYAGVFYHRKAFEFGVAQIEVSAVAGSSVSFMKSVRPGPGLEVSFGFPKAVRCIEDVVLVFGSLKEVEFHKAGNLFQVRGPGFPDIFEFGFVTLNYAKAVHCDEVHMNTTYGLLCRKPTFSVFVYAAGASADFRKSFFYCPIY